MMRRTEGPHGGLGHYGVRTKRYKLIHFYTTDEWEFYDLDEDSLEIQNFYENDDYQSKISSLKQELIKLKEKYKCE